MKHSPARNLLTRCVRLLTRPLNEHVRRSSGITIGFLLLVLAIVGCGGDDSRAADNLVVFTASSSDSDGGTDIFRVDDESGDPVRLTTASGRDYAPAWSAKRDLVAFISDRNGLPALWIMDWTGESKQQLTGPGTIVNAFRWAPDSERIGVEIVEDESSWIGVIDIESGELEPLTLQSESARIGDWSPDGEWLVYAVVDGEANGIRRRNPNGVDEIVITEGDDTNASWSPDGRWIAFNRASEDGASVDLHVTDKDGNNVTNLVPDAFDEISYDWAPDGKHLAFVSESSGNAEIYLVEPSGKNVQQLTSNRVIDAAPNWNSKGSAMLFLSEGDGSFDIYSMNKNGEQQKRMTSISDAILEANW